MRTTKLQEDLRLVASGGTEGRPIYLVEEAPRHRLASFQRVLYQLPLPWVYYVVIYNDVETAYNMFGHNLKLKNTVIVQSVYCSPKKIRNDKDGLDWLPIANSAPGQVCDYGMRVNKKVDRLEAIHGAINSFWSADGNGFLCGASKLQKQLSSSSADGYRYSTYKEWEKNSTYKEWEKKSIDEVLSLSYESIITMGELRTRVVKDKVQVLTRIPW